MGETRHNSFKFENGRANRSLLKDARHECKRKSHFYIRCTVHDIESVSRVIGVNLRGGVDATLCSMVRFTCKN